MSTNTGSPVSNLTYDLITALQNKLQAITAYDKFLKDAHGDEQCTKIFQQMEADDRKHIDMLKQELTKHFNEK